MFGLQNVEPNECGELNTTKVSGHHGHRHFPFNKKNVSDFIKRHKSHNRMIGPGVPAEFKRYNQRYNTSTTNELLKTSLFNPTRGSEKTKFYEHETNMHLLYEKSKPRFEEVNNRDTEIVDKINAMKKPGPHFEKRHEHSSRLRVRRI
jgi:hypothetical protein